MNGIPKTVELFDLGHTLARELLEGAEYPHLAITELEDFILSLGVRLGGEYEEIDRGIFIARHAHLSKRATVKGPTIICKGADVRPGAFIRGAVILGEGAVIGNCTELKNSIIFDEASLPHYNYVGDSIIGYRAHMGASSIAANQRLDKRSVKLKGRVENLDTGMKKLGIMLGDYAEVGCGSVLSPGTVVGRESLIYPLSDVRGIIPEKSIFDGRVRRRI
jgi:NDP-sugar pyrophosphorylase family protein